jgi:hypothetical protein
MQYARGGDEKRRIMVEKYKGNIPLRRPRSKWRILKYMLGSRPGGYGQDSSGSG